MPVEDVNYGDEKVLMIACGANFSLCYTELGVLYYWGMLVPEDFNSINWYPNFLTISYPRSLQTSSYTTDSESFHSFRLTDLKATFREILACDVSGRIYHCDLNYTQTLKPYNPKVHAQIGSGHKLFIGRSMHLFLDSLLSLEHCRVLPLSFPNGSNLESEVDDMPEIETLLDNVFSIKLANEEGEGFYVDAGMSLEELRERYPITVVINSGCERGIQLEYPGFNFRDALANGVQDPKDPLTMFTYNPGYLKASPKVEN